MIGGMDKATKKQLIWACKPDDPIPPSDPRHVDFDAHGLRGRPWRERVAEVIEFASEPTAQGVTGLRGSGKTTELKQLAAEMQRQGYTIVLADAGAWVRDDAPIDVETIWLALVLSLYPEGGPDSKVAWLAEYARRVWSFLSTEVDVTQISAKVGALTAKATLTTDDTLFQRVAKHLASSTGLRDQVFELLAFAARSAEGAGAPLVILLDGIEKRATGDLHGPEEREKYRSHWFSAFLTRAPDLKPPVHVVYTLPSFMIRRAAEFGEAFGQEMEFLPMVRVWGRVRGEHGPAVDRLGVHAMREALFLRIPAPHFEDRRIADWLILHSGGFMRDLLRMATQCVYACRPPDERITQAMADEAVARVRQTYLEGLYIEHETLLREVQKTRDYPLNQDLGPLMDRLLQSHAMMRYHNSHWWYGAHPLLWSRLEVDGVDWDRHVAT